MTKTVCDVCGKEIPNKIIPSFNRYRLSRNGKFLDFCNNCAFEFDDWVQARRKMLKEGDLK